MSEKGRGYVKLALWFIGILFTYLVVGAVLQAFCREGIMMAAVSLVNSLAFSAVTFVIYRRFFRESAQWIKGGPAGIEATGMPLFCRSIRGPVVTAVLSCTLIAFFDLFYEMHGFKSFLENRLFCLLLAAAAGIAEEVIFRSFLLDYISKKSSFFMGLVVSSAVFGLLHILNFLAGQQVVFLYVFNCIAAGVFMSVLYWEYGLACSVLFHISWNAVFAENAVESKPLTGIALLVAAFAVFLVEERLGRQAAGKRVEKPKEESL